MAWPVHKTQCDPHLDFFRVPPLSKQESQAILLINTHRRGLGSYPHIEGHIDIPQALKRCGAPDPENVERHVKSASGPDPLNLEQTKLALLFRFYLRSYRYNTSSVLFHRLIEGTCYRTVQHFVGQAVFPLLAKLPSGESYLQLAPEDDQQALRYALDFCKSMALFSLAAMELSVAGHERNLGKMAKLTRVQMHLMLKVNEAWRTLPKHRSVVEAGAIGYHRGIFKRFEDDHPFHLEEPYLLNVTGRVVVS
ncbi:hypothetical protein JCM10213_003762 [Rhodosporidiobolus nylandii]